MVTARGPVGGSGGRWLGLRALVIAAGLVVGVAACSDPPEVPAGPDGEVDPVLAAGRDAYASRCSSCHGAEGQGGRGPKLGDGASIEAYPDPADMAAVITQGKGSGMPAFADVLDADEIEAVIRYIREVL